MSQDLVNKIIIHSHQDIHDGLFLGFGPINPLCQPQIVAAGVFSLVIHGTGDQEWIIGTLIAMVVVVVLLVVRRHTNSFGIDDCGGGGH